MSYFSYKDIFFVIWSWKFRKYSLELMKNTAETIQQDKG